MAYSDLLKDPRWQKKRLEIFSRDEWTCLSCGREDETLHVHHLAYLKGLDPWEYDNHFLVTYCEKCHETEHCIGSNIDENLIDIIKHNTILIKPLSQLCILLEKFPPFSNQLRDFLNTNMMIYLQEMKKIEDGIKKGTT